MDHRTFVTGRQGLWQRLDQGLIRFRKAPRATSYAEVKELAALYRQALHDQALAQARFSGTQAAARLQRLLSRWHLSPSSRGGRGWLVGGSLLRDRILWRFRACSGFGACDVPSGTNRLLSPLLAHHHRHLRPGL